MDPNETFSAYAAHELKGPLTLLRGYAELLQDENGTEEIRRKAALQIARAAERLDQMIDSLKTLSGIRSVELEEVDLQQALFEVKQETKALHPEASIHLLSSPLPILAHPTLLHMVLSNLFSNSIRYSSPPARIEVRITPAAHNRVAIAIQDWGRGIPSSLLTKIFDPFFMVDPPFSKREGGSGLGLSIVKKAMEAQAGEIQFESEEGAGTLCTLFLPRPQSYSDLKRD